MIWDKVVADKQERRRQALRRFRARLARDNINELWLVQRFCLAPKVEPVVSEHFASRLRQTLADARLSRQLEVARLIAAASVRAAHGAGP